MILRRFGDKMLSVRPAFDAHAMNEVGFTRDGTVTLSVADFEQRYQRGDVHELTAHADGDVQDEVEQAVLRTLQERIAELEAEAGSDGVLLIESQAGVDYPKTRGQQTTIVVETENRLRFAYTIEPPLRLGSFRPR